jgi:hypothetical protein
MKRHIFILFSILFLSAFGFAQSNVSDVLATIDTSKIKVGEQTEIYLEATFQSGSDIIFPPFKDTLFGGIDILEIKEIDTAYEADVKYKRLSQRITITAWDSGFYPIPPFEFIINGETFKTKALLLEVTDVMIEAEADIKDIKDINETGFSFKEFFKIYWPYFVAGLLLIGGIIFLIYYLKNKPKIEKIKEIIKPSIPPHITAIEALKQLEVKKLWQQEKTKEYYSELTHILRQYLEHRFEIHALEQTSDEIISALRYTEIDEAEKRRLIKVLMIADMVKFAKEKPVASENEMVIKEANLIVENTKLIEVEPKKDEEAKS